MELTYRFIDLNKAPAVPPGTAAFVDVNEDLMSILQRLVLTLTLQVSNHFFRNLSHNENQVGNDGIHWFRWVL